MNEIALTPSTLGAEIRELTNQAKCMTVYYGVEIGRRLCAAKQMVDHGQWAEWIRQETEFSQSTATRFMKIFEEYGADQIGIFGALTKSSTLTNLSISNALRLLAVPENEREEFAQEVDAEHISARELERAIKERDDAKKEAEKAKQETAEAEERLRSATENTADLEKRLKEAESRPVEVAVQRDEKAIEEAAQAAKKETEAEWKAKLDKQKKDASSLSQKITELEAKLREAESAAGQKTDAEDAEQLRDEIASLKKQLIMSDSYITVAKVQFQSWQKVHTELASAINAIQDEEKREAMRKAVNAQLRAWLGEKDES